MTPHDRAMQRRFALAAIPLALALLAAAPPARRPAPPLVPEVLPDTMRLAINTEQGAITVEIDLKRAPVTARNFLRYADERRFDGVGFYRSMHLAWGDQPNGLIQTGTRGDPRRSLPPIAHEPTSQTGILHKAGALSMARWAPGTAAGDFSILLSDMPGLDADPSSDNPERQAGFAAFGHVVEGMDVVRRIWDAPRSATAGEGVMKGQMLEPTVKVISIKRAPLPPQTLAVPPEPAP